jgi:hypothetical protein
MRFLVAVLGLALASPAFAEGGSFLVLAIVAVYIPSAVAFATLALIAWFVVPRKARVLALALCATPFALVPNGAALWPLVSYFWAQGTPWGPGMVVAAVISVLLTFAVSYGLFHALLGATNRKPES